MPKRLTNSDALTFGKRLVALLAAANKPRRGAGTYLAKRYDVAVVTANAWLNGEYRPNTSIARRIAVDHGSTFDALYFGAERAPDASGRQRGVALAKPPPPAAAARGLLSRATPRSRRVLEAIIRAADAGALTDADLDLLGAIARRFQEHP